MDLEKLKDLHQFQRKYLLTSQLQELNEIEGKIIRLGLALNPLSSTYIKDEYKREFSRTELAALESHRKALFALNKASLDLLESKQQAEIKAFTSKTQSPGQESIASF